MLYATTYRLHLSYRHTRIKQSNINSNSILRRWCTGLLFYTLERTLLFFEVRGVHTYTGRMADTAQESTNRMILRYYPRRQIFTCLCRTHRINFFSGTCYSANYLSGATRYTRSNHAYKNHDPRSIPVTFLKVLVTQIQNVYRLLYRHVSVCKHVCTTYESLSCSRGTRSSTETSPR